MKLPVLLMLLYCFCISHTREITHEDIKDAMLSLVHMMRENTEKLDRQEAREQQLGEQLKKTISILTKRLTKLDERLSGIEHLLAQKDERERIQMQKTVDSLENLESRLESTNIKNKVAELNNRAEVTSAPNNLSEILNKLSSIEGVRRRRRSNSIGEVARLKEDQHNNVVKINGESVTLMNRTDMILSEMQHIAAKIGDLEKSLEEVKQMTQSVQEKSTQQRMDMFPAFDDYVKTLVYVQDLLKDTSNKLQEVPRMSKVQAFHNETQVMLQETKYVLKDIIVQSVDIIEGRIMEGKGEIKDSVAILRMELAINAEHVNQELRNLTKDQSVIVSIADHVLDTKKRVEYGVNQILLEVSDLVKTQGININSTLSQRFDGISNIMDNQNGALANLISKMELEMNKVWQQNNIVYQEMTESARALNKLQNGAYVNGTTFTMGGMENKIDKITKHVLEVDKKLNNLPSYLTQKFNQVKTDLADVLVKIFKPGHLLPPHRRPSI